METIGATYRTTATFLDCHLTTAVLTRHAAFRSLLSIAAAHQPFPYKMLISAFLGNHGALAWTKKSAENGYWQAQNFLGVMYLFGKKGLIERNRILALKWMTLGYEAHPQHNFRSRLIYFLLRLFTPRRQLAEAAKLVERWKDERSKPASVGPDNPPRHEPTTCGVFSRCSLPRPPARGPSG
jgi:hypothetical protein